MATPNPEMLVLWEKAVSKTVPVLRFKLRSLRGNALSKRKHWKFCIPKNRSSGLCARF